MPSRPDYCKAIGCPFFNNGVCYEDRQIGRNIVGPGSSKKKDEWRDKLQNRSKEDPEGLISDCQMIYESYF